MLFLIIDTSLQGVTVGLAKQDGNSYHIHDVYGSSHPQEAAAKLPDICKALLKNQSLGLHDVDGMLISNGPGSFTGIKIGLSFALGWKRAGTPIKVWAISSLRALLQQNPEVACLALPATQTAGYLAIRTSQGLETGVIDFCNNSICYIVDDLTQSVKPLLPLSLSGVEVVGCWPRLEEWLTNLKIGFATCESKRIHRAVVAGMMEEFIANFEQLSEGDLAPLYLRKSAPEEKLDAAKANS